MPLDVDILKSHHFDTEPYPNMLNNAPKVNGNQHVPSELKETLENIRRIQLLGMKYDLTEQHILQNQTHLSDWCKRWSNLREIMIFRKIK